MSDYLANLAARACGHPAPGGLRPRLQSPFEPAAALHLTELSERSPVQTTVTAPLGMAAPPPPKGRTSADVSSTTGPVSVASFPNHHKPPKPDWKADEIEEVVEVEHAADSGISPIRFAEPSVVSEEESLGPQHSGAAPPNLPLAVHSRLAQADQTVQLTNGRQSPPSLLRSDAGRSERPPANAVIPELSRLSHKIADPSEARPSIRVTIGRVDVRAIMSAPPTPPPPRTPSRKVSLEDYLQRNGTRV
jgi:hypothetical protein